ncbi:MAG: nucleotidyltransferase substrate binding protein [Alphaproteobacteria bacterium]
MERVNERLAIAEQALSTLQDLCRLSSPSAVERDAAIARFVYTFEAVWRAARRFLMVREGVDVGSPKACIRASRDAGLLSDAQTRTSLVMADDRNLTVHTYNEELAAAIFSRLPGHAEVLVAWLADMRHRLDKV